MQLWCWWSKSGNLCFDTAKPVKVTEENRIEWYRPGEYIGSISTYCFARDFVTDLMPHLPEEGECKQVWLHELWGHAKDFPNYDKDMWKRLQHAMEFEPKEQS